MGVLVIQELSKAHQPLNERRLFKRPRMIAIDRFSEKDSEPTLRSLISENEILRSLPSSKLDRPLPQALIHRAFKHAINGLPSSTALTPTNLTSWERSRLRYWDTRFPFANPKIRQPTPPLLHLTPTTRQEKRPIIADTAPSHRV